MGSELRNDRGFTLVETMIALGIGTIVALSFGAAFKMMGQTSKDASQAVGDWTTVAVVGTNFSKVARNAKSSSMFLHLPISAACTDERAACIRKQTDLGYENGPADSVSAPTLEFYADRAGDLKDTYRFVKHQAAVETNYTSNDILSLQRSPASVNQLQATWPLIDEQSAPFPMLVQAVPSQYVLPNFSARSNAVPGSWMFVKFSNGSPFTAKAIVNQLVAIYSVDNPNVYTIQFVRAARNCADTPHDCQNAVGPENVSTVTPQDLVIQLVPFDAAHGSSVLGSFLPPTCTPDSSGCWSSSYTSTGAFPSISTSVHEAGLDYFSSANFDPRRLLHYFHSSGITGTLVIAPVQLVSYRIVKNELVRDVLHPGTESPADRQSVISDLQGPVMFSRQLGGETLTLTQFKRDPAGKPGSLYHNIVRSMSGTMRAPTLPSASMNRKSALYPKDCDMTFQLQPYCGDSDVADYYKAHPNENFLPKGSTSLKLVLGYWLEAIDGPKIPTKDNWFAVGYDDIDIGGPHAGLRMVNSNDRRSGSKMIKDEIERVVSLTRYLKNSDQYSLYSAAMLCTGYDDASGTTSDAVNDDFSGSASTCSPNALSSIPYAYSSSMASVSCPLKTVTCTGGYLSPSYAYDSSSGTYVCTTTVVCPSSVPTSSPTPPPPASTPNPDPCASMTLTCSSDGGYFTATTTPGGGTTCTQHCPKDLGGSCFEAGTLVTMGDGSAKKIEDVEAGEITLSYDEDSQTLRSDEVIKALHHKTKWENVFHITLDDGRVLNVNDAHSIFIVGEGRYEQVRFIYPRFLSGEDLLFLDQSGRSVHIRSITAERKLTHLYNLHVRGVLSSIPVIRGHNYFAEGILVHNALNTDPEEKK